MAKHESEQLLALHSPAHFKALGHPLRHRMVNLLRQRPASLRQLAAALGIAKGTAGFHVRVLREAGLVRLAETRHVRGGTEQYFALSSKGFTFDDATQVGAEFLVKAAMDEMVPPRPGQPEHTVLRHLWLTADQARALAERLRDQAAEPYLDAGSHGEPYGLLLSLFPADIPQFAPDDAG
jgi:DNA-binding transcriptional ArsR family regulator